MAFEISGNVVITNDGLVNNINGASGSRPGSPTTGQLFFNTTSGELEVWNGSAWKGKGSYTTPAPPTGWGWGESGFSGEAFAIGNATAGPTPKPVQVAFPYTDWALLTTGGPAGSLTGGGILPNGTLWMWGNGSGGKLGNNSNTNRSSPVSLTTFTDWVGLSIGYRSASAVRGNGTIWGWGTNNNGQLGDNTQTIRSSPVSVIGGFTDWIQVSTDDHTLGLRANGQIWAWGASYFGQLGNDNPGYGRFTSPVSVVGGFTDWTQVSAGAYFSMGLRGNGTVWGWGVNNYQGTTPVGQLGSASNTNRSSPVEVAGGFTDWIQVSAAGRMAAGLRANGTIYTWGWNQNGALGDNTTLPKSIPTAVVGGITDFVSVTAGNSYNRARVSAIRANGQLWQWGGNYAADMGDIGSPFSRSSPVSFPPFSDWISVGMNARGTATLGTRAQVWRNQVPTDT